ncbi:MULTISPECIES: ATP-dependent protease LonB [Methanobacterium]|jgi:Lon-like ATP-dependent protease|uniref:Archaeal Lon protease n=1 Tax=Methanobacterium subterraneum TaxID=59277 RepID=A0A2H4V9E5_9EURY|nr:MULTISPECIES: ATP-dependent protease LonB [Methanobacterium]AUB54707.1 ATP-dependent protease LonB [Methanobacterium subterraneum]AUB58317.1 ATP-dependent protease LonB [Methanobacterium sp. MZ-A1]AUB59293.1 ATP-dependent protease LonB [Methanobacterium subterraneum]MCC7560578.1 ATP-dependent protease LonB [Methanobacterium sp.]NMO08853.1 ATP-dependent protease LonB [Methanobacterium subterraneum]
MANYNPDSEVSPDETLKLRSYKTSGDIEVPDRIIDQIIGQKEAVETVKKAAKQRRNVLLIGEPGVGKSMLAKGMAELLPPEELQDILVYPNMEDNHNPLIGVMPAGEGKNVVTNYKVKAKGQEERKNMFMIAIISLILVIGFVMQQFLAAIIAAGIVFLALQQMKPRSTVMVPKLLINNNKNNMAPFIDATGAHAGALLGDVRHDPYQSGGLGTPAHERVEAGMIHKANKGVLYVDEIGSMHMKTQQELLTAMQEKKYQITGQSETSSGAMVRSQEVPCDFVLVASGNLHVLEGMHPALRSRIRGYGYEVFMKDSMKDTEENRDKLVQFVAQEVKKDGRIPHFSKEAVAEIIHEAQRRAGKKDSLTLKLRDLGGLVRAAGDIAKGEKADYVTVDHVLSAKKLARTLEQQIADRYIVQKKRYRVFKSEGGEVGKVNGLAIIGDRSGIIMPIAAEAAPAQSKDEGKIIATGKLGEIAKEAVQNVSALVKKHTGTDISNYDIHIQFLQSYEGVEGDSASVSVATAVVSALENIPVDQSVALTGSLSIRGDVLPVGGVTGKIEAAAEAGIRKVLIPKSNMEDVLIEERYREKIEIVPVETLSEVLEHTLSGKGKKSLMDKMQKITDMVPHGILQKPATH